MIKLMNAWVNTVGSLFGGKSQDAGRGPDLSRRALLTGAVAAVACGLVVTALPGPAAAQIEFHFGDDDFDSRDFHRRRRSRDAHGRRRSRDRHSRRRSRDHGRRRSRQQFRDWNDDCFPTPFGWICT
jgi:hypothetical protein